MEIFSATTNIQIYIPLYKFSLPKLENMHRIRIIFFVLLKFLLSLLTVDIKLQGKKPNVISFRKITDFPCDAKNLHFGHIE